MKCEAVFDGIVLEHIRILLSVDVSASSPSLSFPFIQKDVANLLYCSIVNLSMSYKTIKKIIVILLDCVDVIPRSYYDKACKAGYCWSMRYIGGARH